MSQGVKQSAPRVQTIIIRPARKQGGIYMKKTILTTALALAFTLCSLLGSYSVPDARAETAWDISDYFTDRDLSGDWEDRDPQYITLNGESVTIAGEGVYVLSGEIADGSVTVNAGDSDKVQLVLSGVSITSSDSAAILVENADKVFITLAEGTENTLKSEGFTGDDVDAVVFSRDDLTFNGEGSLTVTSPAGHGIVGKDDLKFASGAYTITAESRGIDANDSVRFAGGSYNISSGKDAIRAKHSSDADKGYVIIFDGSFALTSGGGAASGQQHTDSWGRDRQASASESDSVSRKGVKASGDLTVLGGSFTIDSADDAFHTDADLTVSGGSMTIASGDDGFHADDALTISGGDIAVTRSYEGIEGTAITISGGNISVTASDDGLNAAGGSDGSGFGFNDMFASDGVSSITISGGTLHVNGSGDGIDSNGDLTVSGGAVVVSGPLNGGNGALDYAGTGSITGGTLIAASSVGMAQNFGNGSTQVSAMVDLSGQGGEITVTDSDGKAILSGTVDKSFGCVVVSSPDMAVGQTYTVTCGGGSATVEITGIITGGSGMGMGGFGMGGFGGRQQGGFDNRGGFGGRQQQGGRQQGDGPQGGFGGMPGDFGGGQQGDGQQGSFGGVPGGFEGFGDGQQSGGANY